jgi:hypothetical protein
VPVPVSAPVLASAWRVGKGKFGASVTVGVSAGGLRMAVWRMAVWRFAV